MLDGASCRKSADPLNSAINVISVAAFGMRMA
jgi:hypothetical protein